MHFLLLKTTGQWIHPGILHYPTTSSVFPPLGLLYIASALEQEGHTVTIIDLGLENISDQQLSHLLHQVDVVAISVYSDSYQQTTEFTKKIKEFKKEIPIIIGGPHCIIHKKAALYHIPNADIVVESEGEKSIIDICHYYEGKINISDIHGISYREENQILTGKQALLIEDLDSIAFPARHLIEKYDYGNFPWGYKAKKKFTSMITSRGCSYSCRFCVRYNNYIPGYHYRQRSAENVFKELEEISKKYRTVSIVDDNFLADRKRSHTIFDLILEHGIKLDITIIGARVDSAESSLYKKMKKAGVTSISFGVETGSQEVLDYYRKNISLPQITKAINLSSRMGFFTVGYFIFGGPVETKIHIEKTIDFMCALPLDEIVVRPFYYEKGSDSWDEAYQEGKIREGEWILSSDSHRGLGYLTPEEIQELEKRALKRFYLRPNYLLRQFFRAIAQHDISRLKIGLKSLTSPSFSMSNNYYKNGV